MLQKAFIIAIKNFVPMRIPVMYNPTEYSFSQSAVIAEKNDKKTGYNLSFSQVQYDDLTINLFFDTYEKRTDVRLKTMQIASLVVPDIKVKFNKVPPIAKFVWGRFIYAGIITNVTEKFTMFLSSGVPVRADVTVTFTSLLSLKEFSKMSGFSDSREFWTVKSGDRLDLIAQTTLGDARLWRVIAKANNIDDVISFPKDEDIGDVLYIPDYYNMQQDLES